MKDSNSSQFCLISEIKLKDKLTGDRVEINSTPNYTILKVNNKYYYFNSENGEYDGTSQDYEYFDN